MDSLYRPLLKQSWIITRRNPWLWFFGLFATIGIGTTNILSIIYQGYQKLTIDPTAFPTFAVLKYFGIGPKNFLANLGQYISAEPWDALWLIVLWVFVAFVVAVAIYFTISAQAAIVSATKDIGLGKDTNFLSEWQRASGKRWTLFFVNLIRQIVIGLLLLITGLPLWLLAYQTTGTVGQFLIYFISFVIIIPTAIIIAFISKYAIMSAVLEDKHLTRSITEGWALFIGNWLVSIELALIYLAIWALVFVVLIILGAFAFAVFLLFYLISGLGANFLVQLFVTALLVVLPVILLLLFAYFGTFEWVGWTILFARMRSKTAKAKLHRIFKDHPILGRAIN